MKNMRLKKTDQLVKSNTRKPAMGKSALSQNPNVEKRDNERRKKGVRRGDQVFYKPLKHTGPDGCTKGTVGKFKTVKTKQRHGTMERMVTTARRGNGKPAEKRKNCGKEWTRKGNKNNSPT